MDSTEGFEIFGDGTIIQELRSTTKSEALTELIANAKVFHCIKNLDTFKETVMDREHLQSTGIGHGVAVAHGKTHDVDKIHVALGISQEGIDYDSVDGEPVHLLFLVANPPHKQMEYLMTLSALAKIVRDEMFRRELLSCRYREEIQDKLLSSLKKISFLQPQIA